MAEKIADPRRTRFAKRATPQGTHSYTNVEVTKFLPLQRRIHFDVSAAVDFTEVQNPMFRMGKALELKKAPSARAQEVAAAAVVPTSESDDVQLVRDYVERLQKYNPAWEPETCTLGDGKNTFGAYWSAEPRDYVALARIIRRVLSLTF